MYICMTRLKFMYDSTLRLYVYDRSTCVEITFRSHERHVEDGFFLPLSAYPRPNRGGHVLVFCIVSLQEECRMHAFQ